MKLSLIALCLAATAAVAVAGEKFTEISYKDLTAAIAAKKVTVIDVNGPEIFAAGHIPGAMDFSAVEKDLATKLPKEKDALIVAYCGSPTCNAWKKGAEAVEKLGYTNIQHFKGGIKGWKEEGGATEAVAGAKPATAEKFTDISFADLKAAIAAKKVFVVDVNGPESYAAGHIPGAIDFSASEKDLAAKLPKDKNAMIVAYCGSPTCNAWKKGADAVAKLGYTNVKHFKGGIKGWKEAGGAVEPAPKG